MPFPNFSRFPRALNRGPLCINSGWASQDMGAYNIDQQTNLATGSSNWPYGNNVACYLPFRVRQPSRFDKFGIFNAGTVSGNNFDAGIYDGVTKKKIVSTGATVQTGTSTFQVVSFTATAFLEPGFYFMALAFQTASGSTIFYDSCNTAVGGSNSAGVRQESSAYTLPATATPVTAAVACIPLMAIFSPDYP